MYTYFLYTILGILFLSNPKAEDMQNNIIGTWVWVETSGGFAGITKTPQSTGKTMRLVISDSTVKKYVNDTLRSELTYTIKSQSSIMGQISSMIIYENSAKQSFVVQGDNLILKDQVFDGFQYVYKRE